MRSVYILIYVFPIFLFSFSGLTNDTDIPGQRPESEILKTIRSQLEIKIDTETQKLRKLSEYGPENRRIILENLLNFQQELLRVKQRTHDLESEIPPEAITDISSARHAIENYQIPQAIAWLEHQLAHPESPHDCALIFLLARAHSMHLDPKTAIDLLLDDETSRCRCEPYRIYLAAQEMSTLTSDPDIQLKIGPLLQKITREFPDFALAKEVRMDLAQWYIQHQDCNAALDLLKQFDPSAEILEMQGNCLRKTLQLDQAEKVYRKLWLNFPVNTHAAENEKIFSDLCRQNGKQFPGESAETLFGLIRKIDKAGNRKKALNLYRELLRKKLSSDLDASCRLFIARYLYDIRENQSALNEYDQFLKKYPHHNSVPTVLLRKSIIYRRLKEDDHYLKTVSRLIEKHPGSQRWWDGIIGRGEYWRSTNQLEKASRDFNRAAHRGSRDAQWKNAWIRYDLKNYSAAASEFSKLADVEKNSGWEPAGLFWKARALKLAGNTQTANSVFKNLIARFPRHYYGQRANAIISPNTTISQPGSGSGISPLSGSELPHCAGELYQSGLLNWAAREFRDLKKSQKDNSTYFTQWEAYTLYQAGKFKEARRLILNLYEEEKYQDTIPIAFMKILYPIPDNLKNEILITAKKHELDPLFIAAVIVQESEFDAAALSQNLAAGYLQLTPKLFERFINNSSTKSIERFNPSTNIEVGAEYLKYLLDRYDGRINMALAAYNAGEHRVDEWLQLYPGLDSEEWTEHIPFKQTRLYVKRILEHFNNYKTVYPDFR